MSFAGKQAIFTRTLTNETLTINENFGITVVAMKLLSGVATYKGTKSLGAFTSQPTNLTTNEGVTVSSDSSRYIDEFIIDASAGVVEVIAR